MVRWLRPGSVYCSPGSGCVLDDYRADVVFSSSQRSSHCPTVITRHPSPSEAAGKLATKYGLVPKDVKTKVSTPGAEKAKSDTDRLDDALAGLPKSTQTVVRSAFERGRIDAALNAINGKTATAYINTISTETRRVKTASVDSGPVRSARAEGGYISGAGNAISDSINAKLSNGEYVVRAAAVQAIGVGELHRLNSLGGPQRAFAAGGHVGGERANGGVIDRSVIERSCARS